VAITDYGEMGRDKINKAPKATFKYTCEALRIAQEKLVVIGGLEPPTSAL
jgi:hypothetical protein